MGAITRISINNLFWLGRYVERVFTTLNSFFKYADRFIEGGQAAYEKYLADINVPNIYEDADDFFHRYVFDLSNPDSINANLDRALGNGIVLREEIKTPSLSYLQMAMDRFESCEGTTQIRYDMLPVRDAIYAFWGSIDNNMTDQEGSKIIYLGKMVERVDLYLRLGYPVEDISTELNHLLKCIAEYLEYGETIVDMDIYRVLLAESKNRSGMLGDINRMIQNVEHVIEVNGLETVAV